MGSLQEMMINATLAILSTAIVAGLRLLKGYLARKGGEKAIRIVEIVAQNTVRAVEQMAKDTEVKGADKLHMAKEKAESLLKRQGITLTDSQLNTFIEAAVQALDQGWKGE